MKDTKTLLANTSSLFLIQIASYILPLVLIPYLTRVLGVETYGVVAFGLSFIAIGGIVTDFGFDLYAPYHLSKNRDNRTYVRKFVGSVFACKVLLLVVVALLTIIFASVSTTYQSHSNFLLLLLLPILGTSLQPTWFYQGMEKMATVTWYFLASRLIYVGLVLVLVKSSDDYIWVVVSYGVAQVVGALMAIVKMIRSGYAPLVPTTLEVSRTFRGAAQYFYSRAAVATYTAGGGFFLGLISSHQQVAYYSAAEQLYRGAQGSFSPLAQALYPYMARRQDRIIFARVLVGSIAASIMAIAIGVFVGRDIIMLIFGPSFTESYAPLLIFLVVLLVNIPSVLLGYPFLGALGYGSFVNKSVIAAGLIQIGLLFVLYFLGFTSASQVVFSVLVAETLVLTLRVRKCLTLKGIS